MPRSLDVVLRGEAVEKAKAGDKVGHVQALRRASVVDDVLLSTSALANIRNLLHSRSETYNAK